MKTLIIVLAFLVCNSVSAQNYVSGKVFLDKNHNLIQEEGEEGMKNVLVSNGRAVVKTNSKGEWSLAENDNSLIFVIQPSGFLVPTNESMVPQHFLKNTDRKQELYFPLWKGEEITEFEALFYGDTQARGITEVNYVLHDVVEECISSKAKFGVALGDIVADDPDLFDEIAAGIGQIGIPWYYVFGNHDHDKDASANHGAEKTFVRNFGPSTYAYEFGEVSFISLNDVFYKKEGGYKGFFTDDQLQFVDNYIQLIPKNRLIVLMMHIPIVACENKEAMFRILEKRAHTLSISGHTHKLAHVFLDEEFGWNGPNPHHHFINGTVSGSWWCGMKDELGIPHATMNDGAPNGYAILKFKGSTYKIEYKAARRPADYQMNIYLSDDIDIDVLDTVSVLVNIFNGSEKSSVEMDFDDSGNWIPLEQTIARDPANMKLYEWSPFLDSAINDQPLDDLFGWKMDYPSKSNHFWKARLPQNLMPGTHKLTIHTKDMFGNAYSAFRLFRIIQGVN